MMKYLYLMTIGALVGCGSKHSGSLKDGNWQGKLLREDGNHIVFNFEVKGKADSLVWVIKNGDENIQVSDIQIKGDSVWVAMPVFESYFKLVKNGNDELKGIWSKAGATGFTDMPFEAKAGIATRFQQEIEATKNISGTWEVTLFRADGSPRPAIAQFQQNGNNLTGTMIAPSGDYRFLTGIVDGARLHLSTFDGSHAYYFTANIDADSSISKGFFYAGATGTEPWQAVRKENITLPNAGAMFLKAGEEKLQFSFPDLNGEIVSMQDERFKDKVVIVQIMGSWCPNCMDETSFLSEFYQKNKARGVEVLALAYEYYEDFQQASNSVKKFQKRFHVEYPMLITGVSVSDSLRTEKTLPQLTPIKYFPSMIFIDKKGKVVRIHAGFEGPGAGARHEALKQEISQLIDQLLQQ